DWEKYLLEERYKYQENSYVQVFDCTGISFGFFGEDTQEAETRHIINDAELEGAVEFLGNAASLRTASSTSVGGSKSQSIFTAATQCLDDSVFTEGETGTGTLPNKSMTSMSVESNRSAAVVAEDTEDLLEDIKTDVTACSESESCASAAYTIRSDECIVALLQEICEKLSESWSASSQNETITGEVRLSATSGSPNQVNHLEGEMVEEREGDTGMQSVANEASDTAQRSQLSKINDQTESANISNPSSATEDVDVCLPSDWDETSSQEKPSKEDILSDLCTFTWALDTVEDWDNCPASVKCKVILLALGSRCDVIRKRARQMNEDDMGC
ncbi:hypothetical protein OESDEN_14552, partial [Oesophagostomum dentatum]